MNLDLAHGVHEVILVRARDLHDEKIRLEEKSESRCEKSIWSQRI